MFVIFRFIKERSDLAKYAWVGKKQKRLRKRGKNEDDVAQEINSDEVNLLGPKPTCFDTLPFQFYRASKYCLLSIHGIPGVLYNLYKEIQRLKEEKIRQEEEVFSDIIFSLPLLFGFLLSRCGLTNSPNMSVTRFWKMATLRNNPSNQIFFRLAANGAL